MFFFHQLNKNVLPTAPRAVSGNLASVNYWSITTQTAGMKDYTHAHTHTDEHRPYKGALILPALSNYIHNKDSKLNNICSRCLSWLGRIFNTRTQIFNGRELKVLRLPSHSVYVTLEKMELLSQSDADWTFSMHVNMLSLIKKNDIKSKKELCRVSPAGVHPTTHDFRRKFWEKHQLSLNFLFPQLRGSCCSRSTWAN